MRADSPSAGLNCRPIHKAQDLYSIRRSQVCSRLWLARTQSCEPLEAQTPEATREIAGVR